MLFTIAAFAAAPVVYLSIERIKNTPAAAQSSPLPVAGQSFRIAGQEPVEEIGIILRAQEDAEIGELVRLDARESVVDGLTWQIIPDTPDFEVIEDGRRAFFSSRVGGSYLVIIAAAKDGIPFLKHHTITVIGEEPEPGPENLAGKVRRWTKAVEDYEGRAEHAKAMALVFRKLATADDVSVDQMLEATATANSAVLGDNLEKWLPLLEPLGAELDAISAADGLDTREQYEAVWLAIADGIDKGK
jgi:hypothetical protein